MNTARPFGAAFCTILAVTALAGCSSDSSKDDSSASTTSSSTSSSAAASATGKPTLGASPSSVPVKELKAKVTEASQTGEVLTATVVTAPIAQKFTRIVPKQPEAPCEITNATKLPKASADAPHSTVAYEIRCDGKKNRDKAWIAVKFATSSGEYAVQVAAKP